MTKPRFSSGFSAQTLLFLIFTKQIQIVSSVKYVSSPKIFIYLANNSKAADQLFRGKYTLNAVRSQYNRSFKIYQLIVAFEAFTGNGGGDGDLVSGSDSDGGESDTEKRTILALKTRLAGAKAAGHPVLGLTAKVINEWYNFGWYDLFQSRYTKPFFLF